MLRRWCICLLVFSSLAGFVAGASKPPQTAQKSISNNLPVTTSSAAARKSFAQAMRNFEEYRYPETLQNLREATKADPKFAQAFILIARMSSDPAEQAAARKRAKQLAYSVSPGEKLLI